MTPELRLLSLLESMDMLGLFGSMGTYPVIDTKMVFDKHGRALAKWVGDHNKSYKNRTPINDVIYVHIGYKERALKYGVPLCFVGTRVEEWIRVAEAL